LSAAHDHAADHGHGHGDHPPVTRSGYLTGFILSVILTAIPFWLVMTGKLGSPVMTGYVIMALAAVQVIVHVVYFLHLNAKAEAGWQFMATVFTIVVVVITLAGSLWVMYHMNVNMMPGSADSASGM
jgi:cytochrome o ubiquinol oxidase operon protein cyoD